jgi:hypothetical protein
LNYSAAHLLGTEPKGIATRQRATLHLTPHPGGWKAGFFMRGGTMAGMDENPYRAPEMQSEVAPATCRPMVKAIVRGAFSGGGMLLAFFLALAVFDQWWHAMGYRTESSSGALTVYGIAEGSCCSVITGSVIGAFVGGVVRLVANPRVG